METIPQKLDLIRLTDLAKRLGLGASTIHRWRQKPPKGRAALPCVRLGGHWFVSERAAAAWLGLEEQAEPKRATPSQREARIRRANREAQKAGL